MLTFTKFSRLNLATKIKTTRKIYKQNILPAKISRSTVYICDYCWLNLKRSLLVTNLSTLHHCDIIRTCIYTDIFSAEATLKKNRVRKRKAPVMNADEPAAKKSRKVSIKTVSSKTFLLCVCVCTILYASERVWVCVCMHTWNLYMYTCTYKSLVARQW